MNFSWNSREGRNSSKQSTSWTIYAPHEWIRTSRRHIRWDIDSLGTYDLYCELFEIAFIFENLTDSLKKKIS